MFFPNVETVSVQRRSVFFNVERKCLIKNLMEYLCVFAYLWMLVKYAYLPVYVGEDIFHIAVVIG